MSQVLDAASPDDEDGEEYSSGSYHSGDSDEFEMLHREVLERTAVKRDIKDFLGGLPGQMGVTYQVVDRLGEGELCVNLSVKSG
jgi:cell division control protein 7